MRKNKTLAKKSTRKSARTKAPTSPTKVTKRPAKSPKKKVRDTTKKKPVVQVTTPEPPSPTHYNEKMSRPRGRPRGSKNKMSPTEPRRKGDVYFTSDTEAAIVKYNMTDDPREKDKIYTEHIQRAFAKIAENVYNTFKFSYADVSPLEIQKQALSHMVANISKYEPGKGKAFSYFSIVAKNWFILDNNTTYRRFKKHVEICEHVGESGEFVIEPEHEKQESETREFIQLMVNYWDKNVGKHFTKERELRIANAVIEIFRNADRIDVFNKKALYLYIREIADCQTQHITKVINRMAAPQAAIKREYLVRGHIDM